MRKFLLIILALTFTPFTYASKCSTDQFQKNVKKFTLDGQYQLYFDGALASCELSCFDKIECVVACQKKNAKRALTKQLISLHGEEFLKCPEVTPFITKL
jgi:hypothetical protein